MKRKCVRIPYSRRRQKRGKNDSHNNKSQKTKLKNRFRSFFRESPEGRGSFRLVVNHTYFDADDAPFADMEISESVLRKALGKHLQEEVQCRY